MDKREFLNRLRNELMDLTADERKEALEYYEEYFADAGEENEADVLRKLGSPEQAAEQIKAGLRKADEGMYTENGYREKIESDNPPDTYGKREQKRKSAGQNDYAHQNQEGPYNGWQNRRDKRQNRQENYDYRYEYGYQRQQAEKRKDGISGGMIALLVVFGVLASPLILGISGAILGIVLGVLGGALGIIIAGLAVLVALIAVGFALFVAGFPMLVVNPVGGILCIAAGCFIIAAFLALFLLLWLFCGKFFPWLIREMESFGKYLNRKWTERKQKGETI